MKINFVEQSWPKGGAVAAAVAADGKLSAAAKEADAQTGGMVARAIKGSRFTGEAGQMLELMAPPKLGADRILLFGIGKADKAEPAVFERAGSDCVRRLLTSGVEELTVLVDAMDGLPFKAGEAAARLALGARLGGYRFDKYRTKQKDSEKPSLKAVKIGVAKPASARKVYGPLDKIADGVFLTRNLVSEPANTLYPETFAKECKKLSSLGIDVTVLDEAQMKKLGMGALLGVGQGATHKPQLVVMEWKGAKKSQKPVAFVGKGVCFDSGGLSLKPAQSMEDMKWDMGGAGVVTGLMAALAGRKAKTNAIGIVGLVENMPDGNAQRPGDVVTSMSGQTIEVLNTDAEGRLVLADALWYCQDKYKPQFMVDLATLTGAIIIALGSEHAGLFSNDDALSERLLAAGKTVGEPLWRLPLSDAYDKGLASPIADMQNIAGPGFGAGSITAAQFLQRFVNEVPWAHLDIAGVTWSKKDKPGAPRGATAFGVRLLDALVAAHYEG
ncbi:leucyl aminopeptidase [Marinibaculum pumilum]|uniref:Probable cytosol aminopeptidase n=1 Tax=Marinibaculum pumilum TaxID=1766165 RepID=A0ABV7KTI5_9PROT